MFGVGENLFGSRTPAYPFRIVQGESSFGRRPAQFAAENPGIEAGGAKHGSQSPDLTERFFKHGIAVGCVLGNQLGKVKVNNLTQTEK
jgi:hypothetical protein